MLALVTIPASVFGACPLSSPYSSPSTSSPETSASPSVTAKKTTLLIVFVVVFIDLLGFGIVLPLLPRYGAVFNASKMQLGLLMASFSAMQFVFAPIWGALSDRIGRRPVLIVGLLGSTFAYAMFGVATSLGREGMLLGLGALPWLFITRIAAGIAGATIATAQAVIADSTGAAGRGKGMALIGAAFGIGFTFGPLIGAACTSGVPSVALNDAQYAAVKNWEASDESMTSDQLLGILTPHGELESADQESVSQLLQETSTAGEVKQALLSPPSAMPGYVAAALSALALLLAVAKLPESRPAGSAVGAAHRRGGLLQMGTVFRHLTAGKFAVILTAIFITTFAFAQFESTLSLLTEALGQSDRNNFFMFAYVGLVLTIAQGGIVRRLAKKMPAVRLAAGGTLIMVIGLLLIGLAGNNSSVSQLYLFVPVAVVGFSAVTPSLQSLLSLNTAADEQGEILGLGQSVSALARILGPVAGMQLFSEEHVAWPYWGGAGLMVVALLFMLATKSKSQPDVDAAEDSNSDDAPTESGPDA